LAILLGEIHTDLSTSSRDPKNSQTTVDASLKDMTLTLVALRDFQKLGESEFDTTLPLLLPSSFGLKMDGATVDGNAKNTLSLNRGQIKLAFSLEV
jgi:hypothetical protein